MVRRHNAYTVNSVGISRKAGGVNTSSVFPPPKVAFVGRLQRYYGVLSSHSEDREHIVPCNNKDVDVNGECNTLPIGKNKTKKKYIPWVPEHTQCATKCPWGDQLLKRVFKIDILECPNCKSRMKVQEVHTHGAIMQTILDALGISTHPPTASPVYSRGVFATEYVD